MLFHHTGTSVYAPSSILLFKCIRYDQSRQHITFEEKKQQHDFDNVWTYPISTPDVGIEQSQLNCNDL